MAEECPECGCNDLENDGTFVQLGIGMRRASCNNCGWTGTLRRGGEKKEEMISVDYIVIECPNCRSDKVPVTHTERPVRYHRCLICQTTFKSVEKRNN